MSTKTALFVNKQAGGMFAVEDQAISTGNRWFVGSAETNASDTASAGRNPNVPFATLDFAVGQASANNGDIIYLMPNHAQSLAAESAVDIDVAGLTVIGQGAGNDRATFTFTTAVGADFKIAAANTVVKNVVFVAGIDALTGPIEVSAAGCALIDCEYQDDAVNNYETTDVVVTTTAAHSLLIDGLKFISDGGAGGTQNQSVIQLTSADFAVIKNCFIVSDSAVGCVEDATASLQIQIYGNTFESTQAADTCIALQGATTGQIHHNSLGIATDSELTWITAVNDCRLYENYGTNADAETGILIGTPST